MKIGIIGLGLIGGSMAIDLRRKGLAQEVLGVEAFIYMVLMLRVS